MTEVRYKVTRHGSKWRVVAIRGHGQVSVLGSYDTEQDAADHLFVAGLRSRAVELGLQGPYSDLLGNHYLT